MKIFAVVLSYNGGTLIVDCLKKLLTTEVEVIVVDNASRDGSFEEIKKIERISKIIANSDNLGFAKGCNQGIRFALRKKADLVLLLNQDTLVEKNFLEPLKKGFEKNKNLGVAAPIIKHHQDRRICYDFGGQINSFTKQTIHDNRISAKNNQKSIERDFVSGCCLLVRKGVFKKVDLFDEDFFLYFEDVDFCYRVKEKGFRIQIFPQSVIFHRASGSLGKNNPLVIAYNFRNHLFFVKKHFSFSQLIISLGFDFLRGSLLFVKKPKLGWAAFGGIFHFLLGKTGKMKA